LAHFRNDSVAIFWRTPRLPDEHSLALRQADQLRTDIANVELGLEVIMAQLARIPTRKELWRAAPMGMLGGSATTIALAFAFRG